MIRRCEFCAHGTKAYGVEGRYMICKLIPPRPVLINKQVTWHRPEMGLKDWCSQFKLAVSKVFLENGLRT